MSLTGTHFGRIFNDTMPGTPVQAQEVSSGTHPIVTIIEASISSTIENVLAILIGVILSHPRLGLLCKKEVVRVISKMLLLVLLPCFIINSFTTSVDIAVILDMWVIVFFSFFMHVVQYFLAEIFLLGFEGRRKSTHRMIPMMAMTYTNFTFIPMVFMSSLCQNSNIFPVKNSESLSQIYVTLYAIPQRIFFYMFGIYFIRVMDDEKITNCSRIPKIMEESSPIEEDITSRSDFGEKMKRFGCKIWSFFRAVFLSPPVLAVVVGFIVCSIRPLKDHVFVDPPILIKGIPNVIRKLGSMVLGLANIVTGANVGRLFFNRGKSSGKKPKGNCGSIMTGIMSYFKLRYVNFFSIVRVCFVKLVLLPCCCLVFVGFFAVTLGKWVIHDDSSKSLMFMVFLVESSVPLMLSLNIVVSVYDNGIEILSEYLIAQYLLAPFTMTIFAVLSMYYVCSFEECNL